MAWRSVAAGLLGLLMILSFPAASGLGSTLSPTWLSHVDAGGFDLGQGVALAPDGSVFIAGTAETDAGQDVVTVKLDTAGRQVWARAIDKGSADRGEDVATDSGGNAYVAGTIGTPVGDDILVAKYAPDGALLWSLVFDKGTSETARAIEVDHDGNLLLAGASLSIHGADAFVAKLSPEGEELWSRPINLYFVDEAFAVAGEPEGGVVVAGRVLRGSSFDLLVRKYDADGTLLWSRLVATSAAEEARGVAVDAQGVVHAFGTVSPGEDGKTSDALLARFAADGAPLGTKTFDMGGADDEGRDAAFDPSGNLVLAGFCVCDGTKDPFVLKLAPDLEPIWSSVVPGQGIDGVGSLAVGADGARIVAAGATQRTGRDFDYLVTAYDQPGPVAMFTRMPGPISVGAPVTFDDLSLPRLASLQSRLWDFGDGTTSTDARPTHAYAAGGSYRVVLTVTDAYRNAARHEETLVVDEPVVAPPPPAPPGPPAPPEAPAGVVEPGEPPGPEPSRDDASIPSVAPVLALLVVAVLARLKRRS